MNKKILTTISVLIVLSVLALIIVFVSYLNSREIPVSSIPEPSSRVSGEKGNNSTKVKSGDDVPLESGEVVVSGEVSGKIIDKPIKEQKPDNENKTVMPKEEKPIIDMTNPEPVIEIDKQEPIISSNTETSNQEKQQVLNEIDSALQGLLEAVGKVPTVDETKLDASLESEVQP